MMPTREKLFLTATVVFPLAALWTSSVEARPFRMTQIPSTPDGCDTCHIDGGGSPRNAFGQDVQDTLAAPVAAAAVDWLRVCPLDSDGDGMTNGAELGDPDCTWRIGDPPRAAAGQPGGDETEEGGCSATQQKGESLAPLLAAGVLIALRRRRLSFSERA